MPEETRVCSGIRCGHLETLEERIACRLGLTDKELANEFQILYFPEYCKAEKGVADKRACIARYQSFGPCWKLSTGSKRTACAKDAIGLKSLAEERQACFGKSGVERQLCVEGLKEKVEGLIIFHLYELEVQAETLLSQGRASKEDVVALEIFIETKKREIEAAATLEEWRTIVRGVKVRWHQFGTLISL